MHQGFDLRFYAVQQIGQSCEESIVIIGLDLPMIGIITWSDPNTVIWTGVSERWRQLPWICIWIVEMRADLAQIGHQALANKEQKRCYLIFSHCILLRH